MVFSVIHRHPLSRPDNTEVEAKLGEALAPLEIAVYARGTAVVPLNIADAADEPAAHPVRLALLPRSGVSPEHWPRREGHYLTILGRLALELARGRAIPLAA